MNRTATYLLILAAVLLTLNLVRPITALVHAQAPAQYKVLMFDPRNVVDQSQRIADICNSEGRAGWQFVSMGTVVTTTYLVFRR